MSLCVLGAFSPVLKAGDYAKLDGVWRVQIGIILIPCFAVLYFRLTMPESRKFTQSQELSAVQARAMDSSSTIDTIEAEKIANKDIGVDYDGALANAVEARAEAPTQATKWQSFGIYYSEWRHLKMLIGTASTWFFVDVAFYGINLNQSVLLGLIGFTTGSTEYEVLLKTILGNLIIAAAGYVPGYFLTIAFIEILGRKWIQIQGFIITSVMFIIIAAGGSHIGTAGKFACFTIAQVCCTTHQLLVFIV